MAVNRALAALAALVAVGTSSAQTGPANNNSAGKKTPNIAVKTQKKPMMVFEQKDANGKVIATFKIFNEQQQQKFYKEREAKKDLHKWVINPLLGDGGTGVAPTRRARNVTQPQTPQQSTQASKEAAERQEAERLKKLEAEKKAEELRQVEQQKRDAEKQAEAAALMQAEAEKEALRLAEEKRKADEIAANNKAAENANATTGVQPVTGQGGGGLAGGGDNKAQPAPSEASGKPSFSGKSSIEVWNKYALDGNKDTSSIINPIHIVNLNYGKLSFDAQHFITSDEWIKFGQRRLGYFTYQFGASDSTNKIKLGEIEFLKGDGRDPVNGYKFNLNFRRVHQALVFEFHEKDVEKKKDSPSSLQLAAIKEIKADGTAVIAPQATLTTSWHKNPQDFGWATFTAGGTNGGTLHTTLEQNWKDLTVNFEGGGNMFGSGFTASITQDLGAGFAISGTVNNYNFDRYGRRDKLNEFQPSLSYRKSWQFGAQKNFNAFFTGAIGFKEATINAGLGFRF